VTLDQIIEKVIDRKLRPFCTVRSLLFREKREHKLQWQQHSDCDSNAHTTNERDVRANHASLNDENVSTAKPHQYKFI